MKINRTPSETDIAIALRKASTAADCLACFVNPNNPLMHTALTLLREAREMEANIHGLNTGDST
jgi:hypothetical protein